MVSLRTVGLGFACENTLGNALLSFANGFDVVMATG